MISNTGTFWLGGGFFLQIFPPPPRAPPLGLGKLWVALCLYRTVGTAKCPRGCCAPALYGVAILPALCGPASDLARATDGHLDLTAYGSCGSSSTELWGCSPKKTRAAFADYQRRSGTLYGLL